MAALGGIIVLRTGWMAARGCTPRRVICGRMAARLRTDMKALGRAHSCAWTRARTSTCYFHGPGCAPGSWIASWTVRAGWRHVLSWAACDGLAMRTGLNGGRGRQADGR